MNELSLFAPAVPAMIVGHRSDGITPALGLGEPFALLGGDRLGPTGIRFHLMHEHQPEFWNWVATACDCNLANEQPWFCGKAILLGGKRGAGRTHAARSLAHVAGVPHAILNLTDPLIGSSVAASAMITDQLWALPTTIAMAAARCANPVVTVIGIDRVSENVRAGLVTMIDPATACSWSEDRLGVDIDLSQITWMIQFDDLKNVPSTLRKMAPVVMLNDPPQGHQSAFVISIMLEALRDCKIERGHPVYSVRRIAFALKDGGYNGCLGLYNKVVDAIRELESEDMYSS
jgi:hypothetical protein